MNEYNIDWEIKCTCPLCKGEISGAFPQACPKCGFDPSPMAGQPVSKFQGQKWNKHAEITQGRKLDLHGGEYNASYDFNGVAKLPEIVRFTLTFGQRAVLKDRYKTQVIVSYLPEIFGSGTAESYSNIGNVPCSGICLMSPVSKEFSHSFPVLNEWVNETFGYEKFSCNRCKKETSFGQPICAECYMKSQWDWSSFMRGGKR